MFVDLERMAERLTKIFFHKCMLRALLCICSPAILGVSTASKDEVYENSMCFIVFIVSIIVLTKRNISLIQIPRDELINVDRYLSKASKSQSKVMVSD